jgi:copper chaperone NosL
METMAPRSTDAREVDAPAGPPAEGRRGGLGGRIALGVVVAALVVLAIGQPLWRAHLTAPQYPQGLDLIVYGDRVEGDVAEITALNHYVGMRPYDIADFPETALWLPTMVFALVAVAVSTWFGRRWPGRLARLLLWVIPVGALLDVQWRLYQFGHDLDPNAALRIDEFTAKVIGPTKVVNFTTWAWPGSALLLIWAAAFLLSFGPSVPGWFVNLWRWIREEPPYDARRRAREAEKVRESVTEAA